MEIIRLENVRTDENCYLVYDESKKAVAIDPGSEADVILKAAADCGVQIEAIAITHCHYDHITGLNELRGQTGAKLVCGKQANVNVQDTGINLSRSACESPIHVAPADVVLSDGDTFSCGNLIFSCIETPGHTSCGVCYLCEGHLFSGDTLFLREVGRWDFPTGNEDMLKSSIKEKLYMLPDDTKVYPGHWDATTIGYEKKYNFYVKG
jgi:hydroxyacylglutathione hydrolase